MTIKVAINGFGRIGRTFFRQAFGHPSIEIVAINDLGDFANLAYLLRYDTVYGRWDRAVETTPDGRGQPALIVDGKEIRIFAEREPEKLPWKELDIDVVVESTGVFASEEGSSRHLKAGAKRVLITAPAKGDVPHVLIGANEDAFSGNLKPITANASCTTNATVPPAAVLWEALGIRKGIVVTVHGYTATQGLVDGPGGKGDFRRGRAAAQNIVPSHTGAADAVVKSLPQLEGIFDGLAMRVPVLSGSLAVVTVVAKRETSVDEMNRIFREAAASPRWKGIIGVTEEPIVSSDIIGTTEPAIVDLTFTRVTDGDLVTVFSWYDNEWAYSHTLVEHVLRLGKLLKG